MVDKVIVDPSADDRLDRAFMALADPVRRRMIARLSRGPATVNELADPFEISKQAVSKHIQVLEQAGLVTRTRDAQRRPVHLNAAQLEALTAWIDKYRLIHEQQFRRLGRPAGGHRRRSPHRTPHPHPPPAAPIGPASTRRNSHDEPRHHHRAGRRPVHRHRAGVRRARCRGLPRPRRARPDQAMVGSQRVRDGHRALRLHLRRRVSLHPPQSGRARSSPSTASSTWCARTTSPSRPSSSRASRTW